MKVWRLKKGGDRRLRQGHPWIFSSELAHSQKEVLPGEIVELRDYQDRFLAFGYAHPSSQICFRKLSSRSKETDIFSVDFFVRRLRAAHEHRRSAGWTSFSHRWLFAEADGVPGLIVDAFLGVDQNWLVVVQASTAGVERALPELYQALKCFEKDFEQMTVIEAPSSQARKLEGLPLAEKKLISGLERNLSAIELCFHGGLRLTCDLLHGQKTGFFLDQQWNVGILKQLLVANFQNFGAPVRVLDVCCYVGQWASHAAQTLGGLGLQTEVTLVDVSKEALELAQKNVSAQGARVKCIQADVLQVLGEMPVDELFDVVICDPPAFVKKKADRDAGLRAYTKINRDALKLLRPSGLYIASSCSGLVTAEDWRVVMTEAGQKVGRSFKRLAMGGHGPDHPVRPEFPEGEYLKCFLGRVDFPF